MRRLHHARLQRQAQARIQDDTQQRPPPRQAGAVGEQRIVGDDGAHTDHDGVISMAHLMHMRARRLRW